MVGKELIKSFKDFQFDNPISVSQLRTRIYGMINYFKDIFINKVILFCKKLKPEKYIFFQTTIKLVYYPYIINEIKLFFKEV